MQLNDELIKEIQKSSIYAARLVFGHKSVQTYSDQRGRLYNGCDYLEELVQDMLLKILVDKTGAFERSFARSKRDFINLVMASAKNAAKDKLRDTREVPFSQIGEGTMLQDIETEEDTYD